LLLLFFLFRSCLPHCPQKIFPIPMFWSILLLILLVVSLFQVIQIIWIFNSFWVNVCNWWVFCLLIPNFHCTISEKAISSPVLVLHIFVSIQLTVDVWIYF
jgi:hypothetical protein